LGTGRFPAESIDQVIHILFQELIYNTQRVFIRGGVEVEGAAKEMAGRVGDEELVGRSGVAPDPEKVPAHSIRRCEDRVFDGAGLIRVLEGHLEGVVAQFIELVASNGFIADVDTGAEAGEIDVYPPGIFGNSVEIRAVLQYIGIHGILKGIRITGLVEGLVLMWWKIYFKITPAFGGVDAVAGKKESQKERESSEAGYRHVGGFKV